MENNKTEDKLITIEVKNVRHAKSLYTLSRVSFGVATFIIGALDYSVLSIIAFAVLLLVSVFIEAAADERLDSLHDYFKVCMQRLSFARPEAAEAAETTTV